MSQVAKAGFRSVINNRPDAEGGPQQPPSEALQGAAAAAGIEYAHLPVTPNAIRGEDVERFAELVHRLPKPIVAFCRTGSRARALYEAARDSRREKAPHPQP